MIADAVSQAIANLTNYRAKHKMGFKIALQIHDALLFLVPNKEVPVFIDKVLPACMSKGVPITPRRLDGSPIPGAKTYYLSNSVEVAHHWGQHMYPADCWDRGFSESYAGWQPCKDFAEAYETTEMPDKVWLKSTKKVHATLSDKHDKRMLKDDVFKWAVQQGKWPEPTEELRYAIAAADGKKLLELALDSDGHFALSN